MKTVIFAGDYEKITENGITKQLYYISGGDGLAAIYVKQSGQSDQIYYTHTDHLGSIVQLTDNNGNAVFNASYDAWGKQEVTTNTIGFSRGYTGHEHLPEFGLINMTRPKGEHGAHSGITSGRMYDPLVGRFLSPDPFVQAPEYSQSFNRYFYCLNNPLIFTDPSGEFIFTALLSGIGIPSIFSAAKKDGQHYKFWTERRANKRASIYFNKYHGVNWSYPNYPL
ncbi:MAG: RHS domain-containing protein [Bacteroidales bacterium]|nr:RHS domain-containing protein [Bacteroidales bacterium]